ncbi:MAG: DnaJ domain-containing protein [Fimbriimonadales bacterium]
MKQNHYEVLGVPVSATADQIRKRYRELVRRYHPDVNPSPEAKERFLQIQEAYQVLSDPERRRHYDALLRLGARPSPPSSTSRPANNPTRPTPPTAPDGLRPETREAILQAERAFIQGRLLDALHWARQARRYQPRHPKSHEILGDIYTRQGLYDDALNAYTYALQLDPNNPHLQRKFDRLVAYTQRQRATAPAPTSRHLPVIPLPAEWKQFAGQSVGWGMVLFLMMMAWAVPGEPLRALATFGWSANLMLYLALAGLLVGFLMKLSQWLLPLADAFPWGRSGHALSAGAVMVGLSLVSFPLSALLYLLLTLVQGGLNASVSRVFSVVGVMTMLFALLYPYDWLYTLLFGGNLVFLGLLGGWKLADLMR